MATGKQIRRRRGRTVSKTRNAGLKSLLNFLKKRRFHQGRVWSSNDIARRWKDSVGLEPTPRSSFIVAAEDAEVEELPAIFPEPDFSVEHVDTTCMAAGRKIIDGTTWGLFIVVLALITLFIDDFEILVFTWGLEQTDVYDNPVMWAFFITKLVVCIIFIADLILGSVFSFHYMFGMRWWMDFVSTLSMIPLEDLSWASTQIEWLGTSDWLNYLVASQALQTTKLLKMIRVLRLAKVARVLRAVSLCKKHQDTGADTYVIGDEETKNDGDQLRADHLKEQLTTILTIKVIVTILLLMLALPLVALLLGDACSNDQKTQTLVSDSMRQLHIMFNSTQFYDNRSACNEAPICKTMVDGFRAGLVPYLDDYITNISLAGHPWPDLSQRQHTSVFNESSVRRSKNLYRHVCFVFDGDLRVDCVGGAMVMNSSTPEACAPCFKQTSTRCSFCSNSSYASPRALVPYWFTIDITPIKRVDAWCSVVTTVLVVVLLVACVVIFRRDANHLSNSLVAPIKSLAKDMEHVSQMAFRTSDEQELSQLYEISKIQKSFSLMKGILQSFAKFVPREVVRHLVMTGQDARLNIASREITIFFSDIASFTTICESLRSKELYLLLSSYFEEMSKIIVDSNGTLIEYIGDAILAVWNAPIDVEDHACLAVCSTLLMQDRLRWLRKEWGDTVYRHARLNGKQVPDCRVRCGLHTASCFVGNVGSSTRMKYGVVGESVNVASTLEELNKSYGTYILMSQQTANRPLVQSRILFRLIDYVYIKVTRHGKARRRRRRVSAVYEPLCSSENPDQVSEDIAKCHQQGFELYKERQFDAAAQHFEQAATLCRGTPYTPVPARALAKRCHAMVISPPPKHWRYVKP